MILGEPPPSRYDVRFALGGVPVRVHWLFWLGTLMLGARGYDDFRDAVTWVGVVFVSILVHEFGHVLAFRYYGMHSHVVLHMMGGLAIPDAEYGYRGRGGRGQAALRQVVISFAGPAAGFLLAAAVFATVWATGNPVGFRMGLIPVTIELANPRLDAIAWNFLVVNILWGLINLVPVLPLDGGRISQALFVLANPHEGDKHCLKLSIVCGAGLAGYCGLVQRDLFLALLFGSLAFFSYQALQALGDYGGGREW